MGIFFLLFHIIHKAATHSRPWRTSTKYSLFTFRYMSRKQITTQHMIQKFSWGATDFQMLIIRCWNIRKLTKDLSFHSFKNAMQLSLSCLFLCIICVIERGDQSEACWVTNNTGSILLLQYSKDLILHITPISYSYFSVPAHHIQAKRTFWTLQLHSQEHIFR